MSRDKTHFADDDTLEYIRTLKAEQERLVEVVNKELIDFITLKAENDQLRMSLDTAFKINIDNTDRLLKLEAENERLRKDAEEFAALLKAFMFSEVQSREEVDAGKVLIQKHTALKDFSTT